MIYNTIYNGTGYAYWYKSRTGVKTHVLSGAARVARHRPKKHST